MDDFREAFFIGVFSLIIYESLNFSIVISTFLFAKSHLLCEHSMFVWLLF